jgi:PAS domain S-box-containing protein
MGVIPLAREMIMEMLPDAVYLIDMKNRLRDINPAGEKLIGQMALSVVGRPVREVFADWPELLNEFKEVTTGQHEIAAEVEGSIRYFDLQITPIQDSKHALPDRLLVLREITDRVRAEEALRQAQGELEVRVAERTTELEVTNESLKQSKNRYQDLFNGVPVGIYRALPTGEIADANPALIEMVGYPDREAFLRTRLTEHLHSEKEIRDRQRQLEEHGAIENYELQAKRYDDSVIHIEDNSHVVRNPAGDVLYYEGSWRDITQREKAEQALRKSQDSLKQKAEHLETLRRVSQDLITVRNLDTLLNQIIARSMDLLGGEGGGIYLHRPERNVLEWVVSLGEDLAPTGTLLAKGEGLSGKVWETGEPLIITDYRKWEGRSEKWSDFKASVMAVPIQWGEDFLGVINIRASGDDGKHFGEEDAALLSHFATQAAIALENARHYEATKNRLNRLAALREIDIAITASLDLQITFQVILDQIIRTLHVDAVDVLLLDSHSQNLKYAARKGFQTDALRHTRLRLGEGYAGRAALERRTIHIKDLRSEAGELSRSPKLHEEGFVTYYAVPLIAKGKVKGVLEVFFKEQFTADTEWLSFLETLAGQVAIATDNASLFNELERSNLELVLAYDTTLEGWAKALELRDKETQGHTDRVTGLTLQLARAMGISDQDMVHIRRGAILHDIGKMGIPDQILLKPGSLTDEEWEVMRQHPLYAKELLERIPFLGPALDIPYYHHEKWDGSGYPEGLAGEEIPLPARIFAIVDVWDALRSDRPYRKAWSDEQAIEYLREQAGSHFDPRVVETFMTLLERDRIPVSEAL